MGVKDKKLIIKDVMLGIREGLCKWTIDNVQWKNAKWANAELRRIMFRSEHLPERCHAKRMYL